MKNKYLNCCVFNNCMDIQKRYSVEMMDLFKDKLRATTFISP